MNSPNSIRHDFFSPLAKTNRKTLNTTKKEIFTPNKKEITNNNISRKLFGGKRKSLKRRNMKNNKTKRR